MAMIFLRATSPVAVDALADWRDNFLACHRVWRMYADSLGADYFLQICASERPYLFAFRKGTPPEGWKKPSGKHSASTPKKSNKAGIAELEALPICPSEISVATRFGLPTSVRSVTSWSRLGLAWNIWSIGWTSDGDFFLVGPDPRPHIAEGVTFDFGDGQLPLDHFELISEAQYDLLVAQARVNEEKK